MRHRLRPRRKAHPADRSEPSAVSAGAAVPASAAVLVIRVWREGPADDAQLRIRIVGRADVISDVEQTAWMSSVAESMSYLRAWLDSVSLAR